jgi:hypothetical protein
LTFHIDPSQNNYLNDRSIRSNHLCHALFLTFVIIRFMFQNAANLFTLKFHCFLVTKKQQALKRIIRRYFTVSGGIIACIPKCQSIGFRKCERYMTVEWVYISSQKYQSASSARLSMAQGQLPHSLFCPPGIVSCVRSEKFWLIQIVLHFTTVDELHAGLRNNNSTRLSGYIR